MRISAIILAAGRGVRLGAAVPKAFVPLAGRPLVSYSLRTFAPLVDEIVLAVPERWVERIEAVIGPWKRGVLKVVAGGRERQDSVRQALVECVGDVVLVHDAARPFVRAGIVRRVAAEAAKRGAAICAAPATDTIKLARGRTVERTIPRGRVWLAQTPQGFRREWLAEAFQRPRRVTDDSMLVEALGRRVWIVPNPYPNPKITTAEDLGMLTRAP